LSLVLAAVGATVAALIQSTVLPFAAKGGGGLDLVLVIAVVWTMALGLEGGLVWAFLGGLVIDVLLMRPLGLTAFIYLLAVGAAWVVGRILPRPLYPVIVVTATALAAVAGPLTVLLYEGLRDIPAGVDPIAGLVPSTIAAAVVAALTAPLALAAGRRTRVGAAERVDWGASSSRRSRTGAARPGASSWWSGLPVFSTRRRPRSTRRSTRERRPVSMPSPSPATFPRRPRA
jgi:rod shape-determining protein MreD